MSVEVPLDTAAQVLVCVVSYATALFFFIQRRQERCSWQNLYVMFVQGTCYLIFASVPAEDKIRTIVEVVDGVEVRTEVVLIRYLSWIVTCPVMLELICEVVRDGDPGTAFVMRVVMSILFTTSFGVIATVYSDPAVKYTAFALACIAFLSIYSGIYGLYKKTLADANTEVKRSLLKWRKVLLIFFMLSWLIFPTLWLLDPGQGNIIDHTWSAFGHAMGDLISKNTFSILAYLFRQKLLDCGDEYIAKKLSPTNWVKRVRKAHVRRASWTAAHEEQAEQEARMIEQQQRSFNQSSLNSQEGLDEVELQPKMKSRAVTPAQSRSPNRAAGDLPGSNSPSARFAGYASSFAANGSPSSPRRLLPPSPLDRILSNE